MRVSSGLLRTTSVDLGAATACDDRDNVAAQVRNGDGDDGGRRAARADAHVRGRFREADECRDFGIRGAA